MEKNRFDTLAQDWDNNPIHFNRSEAIAKALLKQNDFSKYKNAIEFGAGTGILSILLKDYFQEIILMDNSKEMIRVLEEKLNLQQIVHLKPLLYNLETQGKPELQTDVIFTQMAMHHVCDIEKTLQTFYQMNTPGGLLAIADLYTEDGSFHDQDFDGHLGFDPQELSVNLAACGFRNIKYEECYTIERINDQGQSKKYPIFLLLAEK